MSNTSLGVGAVSLLLGLTAAPVMAASTFSFDMVRSAGLPGNCAPNAHADVTVTELGFAERMVVRVTGLPNTALDLFIIQVPHRRSVCPGTRRTSIPTPGARSPRHSSLARIMRPSPWPPGRPLRPSRTTAKTPPAIRRSFRCIPSISGSGSTRLRRRQEPLPRRDDAVQRRSHRGRAGAEYTHLRRQTRPAASRVLMVGSERRRPPPLWRGSPPGRS